MFSKLKKLKKASKKDEQEFREMIREETEKNDGLAMAIAGKVVGRELSEADQSNLIDSFIDELGGNV